MSLRFISAADVAHGLSAAQAVAALQDALLAGLDPEAETPRGLVEPTTLAPIALMDGIALTNLRTAAVSALAVRHLAVPDASRLVVFGRGPQAHAHATALRAVGPVEQVDMVGRDHGNIDGLLAAADIICCCTTAREPLFDGHRVADQATVVAIGSHQPDARETDDTLARRATIIVESRASALREAGDVIGAISAGATAPDRLVNLSELMRGQVKPATDRPRLFKSTGMSWEDAVIASALVQAT